jgi:hypothetical protein
MRIRTPVAVYQEYENNTSNFNKTDTSGLTAKFPSVELQLLQKLFRCCHTDLRAGRCILPLCESCS